MLTCSIYPTDSTGAILKFKKYTGNFINVGNLTASDYIIYVYSNLDNNNAPSAATSGVITIRSGLTIFISHPLNMIKGDTIPFSYSVMLPLPTDVSNLELFIVFTYDVKDPQKTTITVQNLIWWIAKVL